MHQRVRFARAADGVRIAYAVTGSGYPLVRAAHWLGHLDFDWQTSIWRPWLQMHEFNEIQRHAAPAHLAAQIVRAFAELDASAYLPQIRCPTLVLHGRGDNRVPLSEGRHVASAIPGARLVVLDTDNHVPLANEPAYARMMAEVAAFLPAGDARGAMSPRLSALTRRELDVLEQVARGHDNAQIAARLKLAEKTIRNHITHIYDKIEVETRAQAIVLARTAGLGQ